MTDASNYFDCNLSGISNCCRDRQNTAFGYIWRYSKIITIEFIKYLFISN
jgi:hypothetical protein